MLGQYVCAVFQERVCFKAGVRKMLQYGVNTCDIIAFLYLDVFYSLPLKKCLNSLTFFIFSVSNIFFR